VRSLPAILLALVALTLAVPAGATARPGLRIVDQGSGLTVAGSGFKAYERVHVKVSTPTASTSKRKRAGRHGRFRVRFAALPLGGCGRSYVISARGSRGSRTTLKLAGPPCPPLGPD
jgi:hypothetical protein